MNMGRLRKELMAVGYSKNLSRNSVIGFSIRNMHISKKMKKIGN